jgi:hypothetical protein
LRSAEKYAPWIRKIFIVTDNQTPEWLDTTNPKIKIVDHKEIMPEAGLPCFNACVIEYFICKIPDLSEHFLYANDDMFFNADVQPSCFFEKDGYPIIRLRKKAGGKLHYWWKILRGKADLYRKSMHNAASLVEKKFGKYYSSIPHHNIDAYKKSDFCNVVETVFVKQIEKVLSHRFRNKEDLQRSVILYYALAIGHGHLKYVVRAESRIIPVQKPDFMKILLHDQPQFFCLNDNNYPTDEDRKRIKPFLEELFPEKSAFEK